jgi:hypothetical protein
MLFYTFLYHLESLPGSEIVSLSAGVKKTIHIHDFMGSIGYPIGDTTPTFEDNQATIKSIKASHLHELPIISPHAYPGSMHVIQWVLYIFFFIRRLLFNYRVSTKNFSAVITFNTFWLTSLVSAIILPRVPPITKHYTSTYAISFLITSKMANRSR